jgi:putative ABC transport system substrate-binding protein
MNRRDFVTLLGGATALPLAARAQQPGQQHVGYLSGASMASVPEIASLRRGLADAGFIEGRNVVVEYHFGDGTIESLQTLAAEFVRRRVDVIVTAGIPAARAAKAATTTIPIVFGLGGDPVEFGLVTSLNRPGGNLTGMSSLSVELTPKRLEILHEFVPAATVVGVLVLSNTPNVGTVSRQAQMAAAALGLKAEIVQASSEHDFDSVFAALDQTHAGALVISNTGVFNRGSEQLGALTLRHRVPAIFQLREFAAAGGLMSYGENNWERYRRIGAYAGRILKGEKPADLPVQLASRTELIINLKTAKALGLTVPLTLLGRADEVIE